MKLSYKQHLFLYFFLLFAIFTALIVVVQQRNEKRLRLESIENVLEDYVGITHKYILLNGLDSTSFDQLKDFDLFLLDKVRISLIDDRGNVLYDKDIADYDLAENHLDRPEIRDAATQSHGMHIRRSASTGQEYVYYAKHYDEGYFVRVALPYNRETKHLLAAERHFIYIILLLFAIVFVVMNYVAERFQNSILHLKDFTSRVKRNEPLPEDLSFPNDELGEIGREILEIFRQKEESNRRFAMEQEKLLLHFQYSEKGIGIFTPAFEKVYVNTHFMYYLNLVLGESEQVDVNALPRYQEFQPVADFINSPGRKGNQIAYNVQRDEKVFAVQAVIFDDGSFEITLHDITEMEQTRLLKQQMTSNIAHELRTPVTSIHAYLESLQEGKVPPDKQGLFIERAFLQSERLSELIDDVSLISKMEEAPSLFKMESVCVEQLISGLVFDLSDKLERHHIVPFVSVEPDVCVTGNPSLLYSIFRNMMDNSIKYGGDHIEIHINHYLEDDEFHYFSYYDTGRGVAPEHLGRIFERFYRVDSGRTRDAGGSGLGLSIVRNAVLLHKGRIEARIHVKGGLQFLFTLKK